MLSYLWSGLDNMKIPVTLYILIIAAMVVSASSTWAGSMNTSSLCGFIGAYLVLISDAILAIDRFKYPFKAAGPLLMVTYYGAQWFIASSVYLL